MNLLTFYRFDEPSSYLDVKQRLSAARMIRSLLASDNYVIVVEHVSRLSAYSSPSPPSPPEVTSC